MSLKVIVLTEGVAVREEGDVIIDAAGQPQFFDVIILSGKELKSIVATGVVNIGVPIGIGKYTKKPVAAVVGDKVYIRGIPLTLYKETGVLERELAEALKKTGNETEAVLKKLKEIVISERRRHKKSHTLSILSKYISGEIDELPPHLADIVGSLDKDSLRSVFEKLVEDVY
ncbi:hypothetical protein [Pyrobaculum aerophilum]|uniref:Uncharacterized protein n=1 Tax=Pyrobaculum aerophilum TaxID=13773 RepID=A0A371R1B8_9CREN|nr:hypothetical protein [Pyrobaculum aerophilum]RFA97275.1 hypothetical protein CGL51_03465 [Pyrobaculum aerophilum]RFB00130.1 hypothetical protein CGL52_01955 [Pyrobaculum aerophilum]